MEKFTFTIEAKDQDQAEEILMKKFREIKTEQAIEHINNAVSDHSNILNKTYAHNNSEETKAHLILEQFIKDSKEICEKSSVKIEFCDGNHRIDEISMTMKVQKISSFTSKLEDREEYLSVGTLYKHEIIPNSDFCKSTFQSFRNRHSYSSKHFIEYPTTSNELINELVQWIKDNKIAEQNEIFKFNHKR